MTEYIHPSTRIFGTDSHILDGKTILLGITGSVAAFHSPEIARALIRHGARVIPVMTDAGLSMIGKDLMWWATGEEPITTITGRLEHIAYAGVMNKPADLMLIAPTTTNTVAKLGAGIGDTSVTLIANSLLGKHIPVMVLCVGHEDLIDSPAVQDALHRVESWGADIIQPVREEGKAKLPTTESIVLQVIRRIIRTRLRDRPFIITGGPNREYIDNVRFIGNGSTGRTGIELAKAAYTSGAEVTLLLGPTELPVPPEITKIAVTSNAEMSSAVLELLKQHPNAIVILSAAMADFTPDNREAGKIKSGSELQLRLKPTEKLSDKIKEASPACTLVLFKAEWGISKEELLKRAQEKLKKCKADLIVANDLSAPDAGFASRTNTILLIDASGKVEDLTASKAQLAEVIITHLH